MSPRPRRSRALAAAITLGTLAGLALTGRAAADPAPPFPDLLRQAQSSAPRLAELAADVDQAQGLAAQAGARPNPTAALEVEDFAGSRPYTGFDQSQTTLSASMPLELGGKRPARIAAGRASVGAARARRGAAQAQFAFELAGAYADAEAAELRLQLAAGGVALAEDDARVARALVTAGKEAELRGLQATSAVSSARAALELSRAQRATALSRLTALAGSPAPITSVGRGLLTRADAPLAQPTLDPLSTPTYLAAQAARESAALRVRVERTRATPDLTLGMGIRRYAGEDATGFVASVSAPLPIFDRNRGNVSAAQAELRGAEARLNAARLDAEGDIRSTLAQATAADARLSAARETERTAEEAYRLTRIGYEAGKLQLVELFNARRALADALASTLDARLGRLSAEAALARLQGRAPFGDVAR